MTPLQKFMQPTVDSLHFYIATIQAHLENIPTWGKVAGFFTALLNLVVGDILTPILCLVAVASTVDWFFGRIVAKKNGAYKKELSIYGWQLKAGVLLVILLVRGFEAWLVGLELINTRGFLATALAVGVFVDELDSIDENLRALNYKGIPGLTRVLAAMRAVQDRLIGKVPDA